MLKFFATCPKGLESLLFNELKDLQAEFVKETVAGVAFSGDLLTAMRVCLYCRLASRVLLELVSFKCQDDSDLYLGAQGVSYEQYFAPDKTIAVTFNGTNNFIRNTQYGALRVKDAICDRFVACGLPRPNVQKHQPDIHVMATLKKGEVTISLDLSGQAQFWRHYQRTTGGAPLKENLAAAIVMRSGFDGSQNFIDPMCGSGTLLLEAAAIATDLAPGLKRVNFGFFNLNFFTKPTEGLRSIELVEPVNTTQGYAIIKSADGDADEAAILADSANDKTDEKVEATVMLNGSQVWQQLIAQAKRKFQVGLERIKQLGIHFYGFDSDEQVIAWARENAEHAGLNEFISFQTSSLEQFVNPCDSAPCVVVTNPPYGERMGNFNELIALYTTLGVKLRTLFSNGRAAVISSSPELLSCLRLSQDKSYRLFNGALECQLRVFTLHAGGSAAQGIASDMLARAEASDVGRGSAESGRVVLADGVERAGTESVVGLKPVVLGTQAEVAVDFANRLSKNLKRLSKWAQREEISAYRVYDADLPEYNAVIDRYNQYYVVQEYQAPSYIKPHVAKRRLLDMISATLSVTGAHGEQVIVKSRERQKGSAQYKKRDGALDYFMEISEGLVHFRVNLHDYLDTGLFLDARPLRRLIRGLCAQKSFLNLFAYTCTASVMAALGGATRTCAVDMSRTYLDWGRENFKLNNIDLHTSVVVDNAMTKHGEQEEIHQSQHSFVQADCLAYLSSDHGIRYDVIYIDPPTFSNSKRMEHNFDVQRDHVQLLANLTRHLHDGGIVIFCTNKRHFVLGEGLADYGFTVENITASTFDPDCTRDKNLHSCFKLVYNHARQQKQPEPLVSNTMQPRWAGQLAQDEERYTCAGQVRHEAYKFRERSAHHSYDTHSFSTAYTSHMDEWAEHHAHIDRGERGERGRYGYARRESVRGRDKSRVMSAGSSYGGDSSHVHGYNHGQSRINGGYGSKRILERGDYDQRQSSGRFAQSERALRSTKITSKPKVRIWGPHGIKEETE